MRKAGKKEAGLIAAAMLVQAGCGYILYPERRGQRGGRVDVGVVVMDSLLLLLFIVPGVVAFVVDVSSGTIYLPGGRAGAEGGALAVVRVGANPDRARIEAAVGEHLGRPVDLADPWVEVRSIEGTEEVQFFGDSVYSASITSSLPPPSPPASGPAPPPGAPAWAPSVPPADR
jgi:hypothetical protein